METQDASPMAEKNNAIDPQVIEWMAEADHVWKIPLDQIRPAPWNPPSRMDPERIRGLANSIKIEGQQSPTLIRPVEAELPIRYEIVWGHRRYAALQLLAGNTFTFKPAMDGQVTIKTFIRDMTEEQAMISSGIENLQREGFSDIEEAEFFQTCSSHYGESAVKILSEKLSVSDRYIRKRIEILKLPEAALEFWRSGTWHVGHMEQLLRLGENGKVSAFLDRFDARRPKELAVWQLKDLVDREAVPLHSGNFDKMECKTCRKNTDCQRRLFGGETEKGAKCLDQECFKQKQQAWLDLNWPNCKTNKYGTQAAIIGDHETKTTGEFHEWGAKPAKKCESCPHYTTIMAIMGDRHFRAYRERACLGKADCFAAVSKTDKKGRKTEKTMQESDAPRVAWHGEYFRQQFYQQEIPQLMANLAADDHRRLQIALATLIHSARDLHAWFWQKIGREVPQQKNSWEHFSLSFSQILQLVKNNNALQAELLIADCLVKIALQSGRGYETTFYHKDRQALAEFLDIDWTGYRVTEEYLEKKTKAELVRFIAHDSGLAQDANFLKAMELRGYVSVEKLAGAKKPHLVELLLQCGVDLHGRLPKEIADRPKLNQENRE